MSTLKDRVFDGLSGRFQNKIYNDPRGIIRLNILQDDLQSVISCSQPLHILDAGGGFGQMAIWMAQQGHHVTLLEPSNEMQQGAQENIQQAGLENAIQRVQADIQSFVPQCQQSFDLITFHAVLEWLAHPQAIMQQLLQCLRPEGYLSLMFFNYHSSVMRRLIGGDLESVKCNKIASDGNNGLAPISPLKPEEVLQWLPKMGLELETWSGIRCFHDYMHPTIRLKMDIEAVIPLERQYSQQEPYRALARYQHMLCRKS